MSFHILRGGRRWEGQRERDLNYVNHDVNMRLAKPRVIEETK